MTTIRRPYMIHVEFETENAAFVDGNRDEETARILRDCADEVAAGRYSGPLHDLNGNTVGFYTRGAPDHDFRRRSAISPAANRARSASI